MALVPASTSPRREKLTPRTACVDNHAKLEKPLDFSFMNMTDTEELTHEDPRYPVEKIRIERVSESKEQKEGKEDKDGKWDCKCLRLNNNVLQDLNSFPTTLPEILLHGVDSLQWVDLSFNELTTIDPVLCDLPNLMILYLHGNAINNLAEVDKLGGVSSLRKLTLHGNPIALESSKSKENYRWYVLTRIPQLKSFDMSTLTKAERVTAANWQKNNPQKKKKKKSED